MDSTPQSTPSTGTDETFADFSSGGERKLTPGVLPVIVQPVVPETTGAIASQAIATVPRPAEGTIRVIDTAGIAELNFNFKPSEVHIAALDVDLVMVFADNSKLILPNLAVGLLGANPPKLNFLGKPVAAQAVVAAISQVTLADATPSIHLASADFLPKKPKGPTNGDEENATGHDGLGNGEPPVPPQPIVSGGKFDKQAQNSETKTGDFTTPPVKEVPAGSLSVASSNSATSNPSVVNSNTTKLEDALKVASFAFDTLISARLLQTVGVSTEGNQIKGSTGSVGSDKDASFAVQTEKEVLTGSASGDEIWGDNPAYYPAGTAGRTVEFTLPAAGVTASSVMISNVPSYFKILNAAYIGGGVYEMLVDTTTANTFTLNVAYEIPLEGTGVDSRGFYDGSLFTMNFKFTAKNTLGQTGTLTSSIQIGIRDVEKDGDQIVYDSTTGKPLLGLSKLPTGNIINGNGGDDTIHAAAGADIIDGGEGHNRVVYDMSKGAVSVDLTAGKGYKNFATGDTYVNVQDVVGSDYDDTLIGDGNNNLLIGGKGADSIDGQGGVNTVSYASSNLAVTVDLLNSSGSGGDAAGDRLSNIEVVLGSNNGDLLIGGLQDATLNGGLGDDTIVSGKGADSLVGGEGDDVNNTLDYRNSSAGVSVNLATGAASGGDAAGDSFRNFRNLSGSSQNDTLIGDANANVLSGGAGNDTLDGGAGMDVLDYSYYTGTNGLTVNIANISSSSIWSSITAVSGSDVDTVRNFEGIIGGAGNDSFWGDSNNNYLAGGAGNDSFTDGNGNDTIDGGTGIDTLYISGNGNSFSINMSGTGPYTLWSGNPANVKSVTNIENIVFSVGNDTFVGDANANSVDGGSGNDSLIGGGGADTLFGGAGNDLLQLDWSSINLSKLDGGLNNDTVSFAGSTANISLSGTTLSSVISNAEYLDFSGTSGTATVSLGGDDIQKILTGSSSLSANAGVLDVKFDTSGDSLALSANANYSYWNAANNTQLTGTISLSGLSSTGTDILVYDSSHSTLLATLHYHT